MLTLGGGKEHLPMCTHVYTLMTVSHCTCKYLSYTIRLYKVIVGLLCFLLVIYVLLLTK